MKTTPAYTPRYNGQTYSVGNPAEEAALWSVEKEQEIENLEINLDRALNRLSRIERAMFDYKLAFMLRFEVEKGEES